MDTGFELRSADRLSCQICCGFPQSLSQMLKYEAYFKISNGRLPPCCFEFILIVGFYPKLKT
jgi:hypothetical protein